MNIWQANINDFMTYDFDITRVASLHVAGCSKLTIGRKRPDYSIGFYPEGGYTFRFYGGPTLRMGKNSVLFMPRWAEYDILPVESQDCYSITFHLSEPFLCEPFIYTPKDAGAFLNFFKEAEKTTRLAQSGSGMMCKSILCRIISAMQREYSLGYISGDNRTVIMPAVERIHQCYTENTPSVPELAYLCGVSPEYFRMLFKKRYGTSPVKYINNLRLARAKELLSSEAYTISEVATLSGFEELPYFSREFKKKYGVSPSEFRCGEAEMD